jgi:hypothetical protein
MLRWQDLETVVTTRAGHKHMKLTHLPTGTSVDAEGDGVSDRALKHALLPALERALQELEGR